MDEFEIMRQQLASMKQQLDTQKIVNKELMYKVMKSKTSWLNRLVNAGFFIIPVTFIILLAICNYYGLSQWYSISFLICGSIDALLDFRTVRIPSDIFSYYSIKELKKFMVRQKKERFIQTCIGGSFSVIWLLLFLFSLQTSAASEPYDESVKVACIFGCIIGVIAALIAIVILYKKIQRTNDEVLNEIGKFENDA